jgi:tetratricopeptide (TPR) repeat protein
LAELATRLSKLPPDIQRKGLSPENFDDPEFLDEYEKAINSADSNQRFVFTQMSLQTRAADYFVQTRKPRAEWKKLEDLSAQLAEFDLRCAAGDYDTAASVLIEIDFDYLFLWGHYRLIIELHEKLQGKIDDKDLIRISLGNLGNALSLIGKHNQAIFNYERVLSMAKEEKNRQAESIWLGNLGISYSNLGSTLKAIEFYSEALVIAREISNSRSEVNHLANLAGEYITLGNARKAIEFYEQALVIARKIEYRKGEGAILNNLGGLHVELGDAQKAIEINMQGLAIHREIGNQSDESINLDNTGHAWLDMGEYKKAKEYYQQAIQIADNISFPQTQNFARWGLAQAYLFQNELVNARATIEAALQYDVPQNNHNASALHGIIALRQEGEVAARGAFVRAIGQADEILSKTAEYYSALDAKGLAECGLLVIGNWRLVDGEWLMEDGRRRDDAIREAAEVFKKAREIAPHAGVVKSVLRLFDELAKFEGGEILKDVRKAAEGS